jgi:hypothetical protein
MARDQGIGSDYILDLSSGLVSWTVAAATSHNARLYYGHDHRPVHRKNGVMLASVVNVCAPSPQPAPVLRISGWPLLTSGYDRAWE